jgi:DeoR family glycerol-3-phosphate regulon repressor
VADKTKFSRRTLVRLGHISQMGKFFADQPVPEKVREAFGAAHVEVLVAAE